MAVLNGGKEEVGNGVTIYGTVVDGESYNCSQVVLNGGRAINTVVYGGCLKVSAGGYVENADINGEGAYMRVFANGSAHSTVVRNGGQL